MDDGGGSTIRIEVTPEVRGLISALLRVGLGLGLINTGLRSRMVAMAGSGMPGPRPWAMGFAMAPPPGAIMNYTSAVSSGEIAVGLALTLGYFTLAAAFAAGLLIVLTPLFHTIVLLGGAAAPNIGPWGGLAPMDLLSSGATGHLLACAAVMWLSNRGSNPWSLDAAMFARRPSENALAADPASEAAPAPLRPPGPPAPPPGQRTAAFMASLRGNPAEEPEEVPAPGPAADPD